MVPNFHRGDKGESFRLALFFVLPFLLFGFRLLYPIGSPGANNEFLKSQVILYTVESRFRAIFAVLQSYFFPPPFSLFTRSFVQHRLSPLSFLNSVAPFPQAFILPSPLLFPLFIHYIPFRLLFIRQFFLYPPGFLPGVFPPEFKLAPNNGTRALLLSPCDTLPFYQVIPRRLSSKRYKGTSSPPDTGIPVKRSPSPPFLAPLEVHQLQSLLPASTFSPSNCDEGLTLPVTSVLTPFVSLGTGALPPDHWYRLTSPPFFFASGALPAPGQHCSPPVQSYLPLLAQTGPLA